MPFEDPSVPPIDLNPWVKVVLQIGVLPAIAMYLVYALVGGLQGQVRSINELMTQHVAKQDELQSSVDRLIALESEQLGLNRQQCVNAAKTSSAQDACWSAGRVNVR